MAEVKTQKTDASVAGFLEGVPDERRREDAYAILELMQEVTGEEPVMWGTSIVGFGSYHYEYASGRKGEWPLVGFSPRKQNMTLYIMDGFDAYDSLLADLGKHKTGKSCLYMNKLEDVDKGVLRELVKRSVDHMIKTNS
jgi:hypothetical protein